VTGLSPLGDEATNPQNSVDERLPGSRYSEIYARGNHLLKFWRRICASRSRMPFAMWNRAGVCSVSPFAQISGNALADLLLGFPCSPVWRASIDPQHLRTSSLQLLRE